MKCVICDIELSYTRHANSKYCHSCRVKSRRKIQKESRQKRKERIESGDIMFTCKDRYEKYKRGAERRGYSFNLDIQDFIDAYKKPCIYCGEVTKSVNLDRVVNSVGYEKYNVMPCCTMCNKMKHASSFNDFVDQCKKIADNFK